MLEIDINYFQDGDKRRERHHSVSKLLTGVDDMKIQDSLDVGTHYVDAWSNEDDVRVVLQKIPINAVKRTEKNSKDFIS